MPNGCGKPDPSLSRRSVLGGLAAMAPAALAARLPGSQPAAVPEASPAAQEICFMEATRLAAAIRAGEMSCREVMTAFLERIDEANPAINAICSALAPEAALALADIADRAIAAGQGVGPLHGLPIAIKDLAHARGLRTTFGSVAFRDFVAQSDALFVERLKAAGALVIGKTNTPEFGAGSHTFNAVFGPTRNPYDPALSAGGSSGGAAAALACGMLPIADGSDLGGSLRNPAAWCNVVGFRPSVGRVAEESAAAWLARLPVIGPMARSVKDAALMLSVMAGTDPRDPMSLPEDPRAFAGSLARDFTGSRVAWSADLGYLPVEPEIVSVTARAIGVLEDIGCEIDAAHPDMSGAFEAFKTLRALLLAHLTAPFFDAHRDVLKDTLVWNVEAGLALDWREISRAETLRTTVYHRVRRFLERYEYLVLPVTQVAPFPIETEYPTRIGEIEMQTYIDWMEICCVITVTGLPAISVPCGFTDQGMPVGLQIVGRRNDDLGVLQLAHAFETAAPFARQRRIVV